MLQLGLRANEIIQLQLSDLQLQQGKIFIRKTKTNRERVLPLTNELADAIVDYLKSRMSETPQRHLFLRTTPPYSALQNSSAMGTMVKKYINITGIKTPTFGTHQLRHYVEPQVMESVFIFRPSFGLFLLDHFP